jgi:transposase-like protein
MPRNRPAYAPEMRQKIVELAQAGRNAASLAREYEPTETTIRNWIAQADRNASVRSDGLTTGSQYTVLAFGTRCRQAGVRPSMGSVGDAYDNAMCESFFATLECELIDRVGLRTPEEAETAVFEFIEVWYNSRRRHSALDIQSPIEHESNQLGVTQDTSPGLSTGTV